MPPNKWLFVMRSDLMFVLFFICSLLGSIGQNRHNTLSTKEPINYVLSIDQSKITQPIERIQGKRIHHIFIHFPMVLKNKTTDTLKFIAMSCSFEDIFKTNNEYLYLLPHSCDKNFPEVFSVLPYDTFAVDIPLTLTKETTQHHLKFKVGMFLCNYHKNTDFDFFLNVLTKHEFPTKNVIWSNEVHVP